MIDRVPTVFVFRHWRRGDLRDVAFGPYLSEYEAKEAFQRAYGYWPEAAISSSPWQRPPTFAEIDAERERPLIERAERLREEYGAAWTQIFDLALSTRRSNP